MSFQNYRNYGEEEDEIQHQEWRRYSANKQRWRMCPRWAMPMEENCQIIRERIFEEQIHQQFWTQSFGQPFSNQSTIGHRRMILSSLRELPIDHHRSEHFQPPIFPSPKPNCHFTATPKYHPSPPPPPSKSNFVPHQQQEGDGQIHQENWKNIRIEQNHRPKRELPIDNHRSAAHLPSPIFTPSAPKCHFPPPPPPPPSKGNFVPNLEENGQIHQENGKNVQIEQQNQISKNGSMETENGKEEAKNVDPDKEIMNEQEGFQIRVEANGFTDSDFKVSINSFTKILALDGEHFEENNENGTVTIKKLNRQWKLADDIDLHSMLAFFTADGNVEIMGEKKKLEEDDNKEDEHFEEGRMNNNEAVAKEDDDEEEEQLEIATAAVMASIKTI